MTETDPASLPKGEPDGAFEPLHVAARNRDAALVRALIEAGHDVNGRNRREPNGDGGNTPLWFAAQGGQAPSIEVVELLLDAGGEVNCPCEYGTTPLHLAVSWGHLAVSWGHLELVKCLIGRGADPSIKDDAGKVPLASAVADFACMRDKDIPKGMEAWFRNVPLIIHYLETTTDSATE